MERPQRIRKPNSRYDPNIYVLASFPKKNKHTIIPKHQVTIDAIDEQHGTVRSSGFVQPVRIIAEGTRGKCQERASQFNRDTGSEEVDIRPGNNDEDEPVDDNHIYTTQNFNNDEYNQYSPPTTDTHSMSNVMEPFLDFSSINGYKHIRNTTKRVGSEGNNQMNDEAVNMMQVNQNKNNTEKKTSCSRDSSPKPLLIDEHPSVQQISQENSSIRSNVMDELGDVSEQGDEEEDIPLPRKKSTQKKRKRKLRSKQSTSKPDATVEIANLQKEFLLYQFKVDNRLKALEKTFRILKNRKILKENKNLSNIINSVSSPPPPPSEPEFVLGVDISNFTFGFDEHTRFVRQIFRATGHASNPNAVLSDEKMVTELKNAMKKRDKTLQDNEDALAEAWQTVKESVRQLKHDHKRNKVFKEIRTSITNTNIINTPQFKDTENNLVDTIAN